MAINDLYQVTAFINVDGTECQMTMGYEQFLGSNDADTLEATAQAWLDLCLVAFRAMTSDGCEINRVQVDPVTATDEVPGFIDTTSVSGDLLGESMPSNMAVVIHLPTIAPDAKHNGRVYVPGIPEDGQAEGTLEPAQIILCDTFAATLAIDLQPSVPQDAEFRPVVISRVVDGVPRVPPVGFLVGVPVLRTSVRQQRRRKTERLGIRP